MCIISISTGLVASKKHVESADKKLIALELAQGKLEEIISQEYSSINNVTKPVSFPGDYVAYSYAVSVSNDSLYQDTLKIISVTVYYKDAAYGEQKSLLLTGARSRR